MDAPATTPHIETDETPHRVGRSCLRLALVTETFAPEVNGVAMTLSRLARGMRARGHDVTIVRPRLPADYPSGCPREAGTGPTIHRPGFPIPNYPLMRIGALSLATLRANWRREQPQIVHIATEGPMGLSALLAARSLGIPTTSSFHTNFDQYTDHYNFGWLRPFVARYLRWVHNQSSCTMVPTHRQADELRQEGYARVRILSRGLDARLFHPSRRDEALRASWGVDPETLVLSVVGRVAAEKNLDLAVEAMQAIRQSGKDCRLLLVGDGPELQRYQGQAGVIAAGMRCGEDLATHYASSDLFVFPSMTETYGNVLVEAMASGVATIGFKYAAAAELIDGENGIAVPFGNKKAFLDAAIALAGDDVRRQRCAERGQGVAASRSWDAVVDHFESYLHEALARVPYHTSMQYVGRTKGSRTRD